MSKEAITKVVQRAISDAAFRRQLSTDSTGALRGFDLSADEAAALRAGDAGRLSALGVDQRMSKAFALGGASIAATRQAGTDLGTTGASGAPNAFSEGGDNALSNADATGGDGSVRSALASGSDANSALIDDGASGIRTIIPTDPGGNLTADTDGVAGISNATVIHDDPDGFLAANANADLSGGSAGATAFIDESEGYLTKVGYDSSAASASDATVIHDDPDGFLAANADDSGPDGGNAATDEGQLTP